jgi:hypothetical protein
LHPFQNAFTKAGLIWFMAKLWARTQIGLLRLDEGTTNQNKARMPQLLTFTLSRMGHDWLSRMAVGEWPQTVRITEARGRVVRDKHGQALPSGQYVITIVASRGKHQLPLAIGH